MHVVQGEVPCLLSNGWIKQHGAIINTQGCELRLTGRRERAFAVTVVKVFPLLFLLKKWLRAEEHVELEVLRWTVEGAPSRTSAMAALWWLVERRLC